MPKKGSEASLRTVVVHAGFAPNPITGTIAPDIAMSANYARKFGQIGFSALGTSEDEVKFAYAREGHPNARQLEIKIAAMELGDDAVVFSSGIAAITGLLLFLLSPGDHLVVSD